MKENQVIDAESVEVETVTTAEVVEETKTGKFKALVSTLGKHKKKIIAGAMVTGGVILGYSLGKNAGDCYSNDAVDVDYREEDDDNSISEEM